MEEKPESTETVTAQAESSVNVETANGADTQTESKLDWWNPDTWGKTPPKDVVSKIQNQYNEVSTKNKTLEKDYHASQQELEKIVTDVKRALSDRTYYEEQRKSLGYHDEPQKLVAEPDF